ncbi:DMT family transporter [Brachybacterium sp. AOP42-C2-15]|uniref:DMT family transporter n=1 Tax=unclassified Brachybacterium TaxID=2623841 RepID=UPI003FE0FD4A
MAEVGAAPVSTVLGVVYLGVFPTALAFLLWGYALTHTGAGLLSSSSLLVPAFTVVLAWLLLGEVPPPLAAIGGVLCLAGAAFAVAPAVLAALRPRQRADYSDPTRTDHPCSDPTCSDPASCTAARPGEDPAHAPCP